MSINFSDETNGEIITTTASLPEESWGLPLVRPRPDQARLPGKGGFSLVISSSFR